MSSHHIVREGQEPALIIATGAPCSPELLHQLLEWNPYVMVVKEAVERVKALGIKIDAVLVDFEEQASAQEWVKDQMPVEILANPDDSRTLLQHAFEVLIAKKFEAVNIVWAGMYEAEAYEDIVKYRNHLRVVLIEDHFRVYLLHRKFEKWFVKDSRISLIEVNNVQGLSTQGLLNDETVAADGIVRIEHLSGDLLLKEYL